MEPIILALYGWLIIFLFMTLLWLIHFPIKNAAIVDVGWTFSLLILPVFYATQAGWTVRSILIVTMAALWALRLGGYLFFTRIWKAEEEGRYITLREKWQPYTGLKFFIFFQAQGLMDVILSIPFLLAILNPEPVIHWLEWLAVLIFLLAFVGETASDWQLHSFKKNPENKGKICQKGLWNYSRHPNYFFETVIWLSWGLFALLSPYGWVGLIAPAVIISSIWKVTGIPATEEQNRKSKGEAWLEYERTTSVFVPWFKRKSA